MKRYSVINRSRLAKLAQTIAIAASIGSISSPAFAGVLNCTARVAYTGVTPVGYVYAQLEGMGTPLLCTLNAPMTTSEGTVSIDVCKTWVAGLMTAAATGKTISLGINYGASTEPACNAIPGFSWGVPVPFLTG